MQKNADDYYNVQVVDGGVEGEGQFILIVGIELSEDVGSSRR